jgi:hypothetical protein
LECVHEGCGAIRFSEVLEFCGRQSVVRPAEVLLSSCAGVIE